MIPEQLLLDRILKPGPANSHVVPVSLPITSFGDPNRARVATISINPSVNEFCLNTAAHPVLPQGKKRFVDREVLGLVDDQVPTLDQARQILQGNHDYFQNNPYGWFNYLQTWILDPLGASYEGGSAVHLDLVQWATNPVWSKIEDERTKHALITDDVEFLAELLKYKKYEMLLLNGRTVFDSFNYHDLFVVEETHELTSAGSKTTIWTGHAAGTPFVCWSRFLQAAIKNEVRQEISDWVRAYMSSR
jgi:hypothetical protein